MKQTLLVFIFLSVVFFQVAGQSCTPSWPNGSAAGIIPDASTNLPHALEEVPYDATLQFKVPATSNYSFLGNNYTVTVTDITLISISGLSAIPSTSPFSFTSNPVSGVFAGGSVSCMQIFGTPAMGSAGNVYPLTIKLKIHANFSGQSIQIDSTVTAYKIAVDVNTSIPSVDKKKFDLSQNYPNPVKNKTSISFNIPSRSVVEFRVYNLVGGTLYSKIIDAKAGINLINFDAEDYNQGVYFYSLTYNSMTLIKRLIVDRK